jgi:hypothetical protein
MFQDIPQRDQIKRLSRNRSKNIANADIQFELRLRKGGCAWVGFNAPARPAGVAHRGQEQAVSTAHIEYLAGTNELGQSLRSVALQRMWGDLICGMDIAKWIIVLFRICFGKIA